MWPEKWGPKFRAFFLSRHNVLCFFLSWGLLVEYWLCLKRRGCEAPAAGDPWEGPWEERSGRGAVLGRGGPFERAVSWVFVVERSG